MGNIWRINMKTDGIKKHGQKGLFEFCKKEGIVGVAWSSFMTMDEIANTDKNVNEVRSYLFDFHKNESWKTKSFSTATNIIIDRMAIGDYVWTRAEGIYKIAKVISEAKYMKNNATYQDYDIGFYREVEYCDNDFISSEVPGKIIASFSASSTAQGVNDSNGSIFKYSESLFNGKENTKIDLNNWTEFFSADDVEEIIGLYLQVKYDLYVYTSTNKKSTDKIEFELVDKKGQLYGVQVKTGHVSLNASEFEEISKKMKIFLFAGSDRVNTENNSNIIHVRVSEVTDFIREYHHILPGRIRSWLEME